MALSDFTLIAVVKAIRDDFKPMHWQVLQSLLAGCSTFNISLVVATCAIESVVLDDDPLLVWH